VPKLKSIEVGGQTLKCGNSRVWPPTRVIVFGTDIESYRGDITPQEYHRLRTWQKICGLTTMEKERCVECSHVLVDGVSTRAPGIGKRVALGRNTPLKYKKGKSGP